MMKIFVSEESLSNEWNPCMNMYSTLRISWELAWFHKVEGGPQEKHCFTGRVPGRIWWHWSVRNVATSHTLDCELDHHFQGGFVVVNKSMMHTRVGLPQTESIACALSCGCRALPAARSFVPIECQGRCEFFYRRGNYWFLYNR